MLVPDLPWALATSLVVVIVGASSLSAAFVLLDFALAAAFDDDEDDDVRCALLCKPRPEDGAALEDDPDADEQSACIPPFPCY